MEAFQEHVKYQILKYLFKCLHNFVITGNIADIKFWDLQSVEFEKVHKMTPLRKQTLQNIFLKDAILQLYVLHVCDFSDPEVWDHFRLSSKNMVDLMKKVLQGSINSNSHLMSHLKCERVFKRYQRPSYQESRGYRSSYQNSPYYSRQYKERRLLDNYESYRNGI